MNNTTTSKTRINHYKPNLNKLTTTIIELRALKMT